MAYKLGSTSLKNLKGVHPDLVAMVKEAITLTTVDFTVHSGVRTASEQAALYRRGASKLDGRNRKSKHQKQSDGYGHAVDLVPWVGGAPRWEWPLIYPIAGVMAFLSREMKTEIRWGGVWDRELDDYAPIGLCSPDEYAEQMKKAVYDYTVRHAGPDFIDGPHYELKRG